MLLSDKTVDGKNISEIPWYSREYVINKCLNCNREDKILFLSYNKKSNKDLCRVCFMVQKNTKILTDIDKNEIKNLYENGETIDSIAKIINKPELKISSFLNEIGYIKNSQRVHFKCSVCSEYLNEPSTSSVCKKCISMRETTYKINVTLDDIKSMNAAQNNLCKICNLPAKKRLSVDHCHATGFVRGLLCGKCNFGLGFFKDDPALIEKAIKYIKTHSTNSD